MKYTKKWGYPVAGACAGAINGLFGAGGGMVLIPLLNKFTDLEEDALFPASVATILPICIVSLLLSEKTPPLPLGMTASLLIGSALGGLLAVPLGKRIPTVWLHRLLGLFILWGGIRYLC